MICTECTERGPQKMANAKELTLKLGGRWHCVYGSAPCPCCQPEGRRDQTALTLSDGKGGRLLAHCKKLGCAFADILAAAGVRASDFRPPDPIELARCGAERQAEARRRGLRASICWGETQPISGTIAEVYLRERGITCRLPETLRFHPRCWHGPTAKRYPALVALVEGGDGFALHRTYIRSDGSRKAAVSPSKAMLGAVAGGAVRLAEGQGGLAVAEGIETSLSLACGLLRTPATIWAALSSSGLRGLRLPSEPGRLIIATDSDDGGAGAAAGHTLAERAHASGWVVSLVPAPEGRDWNDVLTMKGARV